jgi:hypothetical protein
LLKDWVAKNRGKYVSVEKFFPRTRDELTHGKQEREERYKQKGKLIGVFKDHEKPDFFTLKFAVKPA